MPPATLWATLTALLAVRAVVSSAGGVTADRRGAAEAAGAAPASAFVGQADAALPRRPCPPVPPGVAAAAGLTDQEAADLCWWGEEDGGGSAWATTTTTTNATAATTPRSPRPPAPSPTSSTPPYVDCTPTDWCDSAGRCTPVCARGSVAIPPWLALALATQENLTAASPLCSALLPGAHNAAITLADGYGALDAAFSAFFHWIRWVRPGSVLRTNNQVLSLTDQLRLGVRAVELDVHYVGGALRIAHCGGLASPALDRLVGALNAVARLLRRPFKWDVETVGCSPSLSSIPVTDQRLFADAVGEVGAWLASPAGGGAFLVLYLDDQPDLAGWGALPSLGAQLAAGLPPGSIFTPADHAAWLKEVGEAARLEQRRRRWASWGQSAAAAASSSSAAAAAAVAPPSPLPPPPPFPSPAALVAAGKRVLVVSGTDYGPDMAAFAFPRNGDGALCGWAEPPLAGFEGPPTCAADCGPRDGCAPGERGRAAGCGRIMRLVSCELQYGPLNCEFEWRGDNQPVLDEATLPLTAACGVNMPSPDAITPTRAAAGVWTWAPGQPFSEPDPPPPRPPTNPIARAAAAAAAWFRRWVLRRPDPPPPAPGSGLCGVLSAADGRWVARPCSERGRPAACRPRGGGGGPGAPPAWTLPAPAASGYEAACPPGSDWAAPRDGRDAAALVAALAAAGGGGSGGPDSAWLPVRGPDWVVPVPEVAAAEAAVLGRALGSGVA